MLTPETIPGWFDPSGALLSVSQVYRYLLWRSWGPGPRITFIGLNPSTADATQDDPTIRRCIGYAKSWGYDGLVMANLFAYRSTDPTILTSMGPFAVGPYNDTTLIWVGCTSPLVVCAWGTGGRLIGRGPEVATMLIRRLVKLHALKSTKDGAPAHPLYLKKDLKPVPWRPT